jgi:hypothetical protein
MTTDNLFFKFLLELFTRFRKTSPKFFQIWSWVLGLATALTGLPAFLTSRGITLPTAMTAFENKYIGMLTTGALFMSLLTSQSAATSISTAGPVNKQTDPKLLPFTAAVEVKAAEKQGKPIETNPNKELTSEAKPTISETPKQ